MVRRNLRDDQGERIEHLLLGKASNPGRSGSDNRHLVEAILSLASAGAPWRDLPGEFGKWNSVYQRFARWQKREIWTKVFEELAKDADFEQVFIDSTVIRVHQHGAGAGKNTVSKQSGDPAAD
jgi:transposase